MIGEPPGFCKVLEEIIREIAIERGEDPQELKRALIAKIRAREKM